MGYPMGLCYMVYPRVLCCQSLNRQGPVIEHKGWFGHSEKASVGDVGKKWTSLYQCVSDVVYDMIEYNVQCILDIIDVYMTYK